MAIYRLLRDGVFSPEDIRCMAGAYEAALGQLGLKDRGDPATELVARKIVEIFHAGERDMDRLCTRALEELGNPRVA